MADPNATRNGGPKVRGVRFSASAGKTFQRCNRKWWYNKVIGIQEPEQPHLILGTAMHAHLEDYAKGQLAHYPDAPKPLFNGDEAGRIANSGLKIVDGLIAEFGEDLLIERGVEGMVGPLPYLGFLDLSSKKKCWIGDYKSTSNISYAASPDKLARDFQLTFYAMATGMYLEDKPVDATHIYFQTRNGKRSLRVDTTIAPETVGHFKTVYEEIAVAMYEAAGYTDRDSRDLEGNPHACGDFRGCPYASFCPYSPQNNRPDNNASTTNPFASSTPYPTTEARNMPTLAELAAARRAQAAANVAQAPATPAPQPPKVVEAAVVDVAKAAKVVNKHEVIVASDNTFQPPEVSAPEAALIAKVVEALANTQASLGAKLNKAVILGTLGAKGIDKRHFDYVVSLLEDAGCGPAAEDTPAVVPPPPEADPTPTTVAASPSDEDDSDEPAQAQVDGYDTTDAGAAQALADLVVEHGACDAAMIDKTLREILGVKRLRSARIDSVVQIGVDRNAFGVEVGSDGKITKLVSLKAEAAVEAKTAPEVVEAKPEVVVEAAPAPKVAPAAAPKGYDMTIYVDIVDSAGIAVDVDDWLAQVIADVEFESGGMSYTGHQYNEGVKAVVNKIASAMVKGSLVPPAELTISTHHPLYANVIGILRRRCKPRVFFASK